MHRDYQGSILAITNDLGAVLEKRQFDAWGAILKVQDGANNVLNGLTILDRGYTGHEHLQSVGLINMNGRLYDPKLHRFLQPDNYVQDTENTQNYNRYSYVLNNPLKYTDPSGEKWKITWSDIVSAVAIVAGTVLTFTGFPMIGVPLIGAGVAHFTTAINEFKQTGDWVSASNNAGFIVSFTVKTDFGYDSDNKPNGVTQEEPIVKPIVADDVRNMSAQSNQGSVGQPGSFESVIPIWGSGRAAIDDFQNGNYGWGLFNTALALSDVFLVKSLATGIGKGAWKLGSHTWGATRNWLGKNGYAEAGQPVHHWAVTQATAKKYGVEGLTNQPWNLMTFPNQSLHIRAGHGMNYLGQPGYGTLGQFWYGTPTWFKTGIFSGGGRIVD